MRPSFYYHTVFAIFLLCSCTQKNKIERKPNVIVILSDDQGYADFSCYGNPILKTPNLDKLHSESISFSNFHVSQVCTPTRGELMSGLDALHNKASMVPSGRNLMKRNIATMPQVFKENGYTTGLFGKWHLGDSYPDRPHDKGFDRVVWHKGWGIPSEIEFDNDYYKTRYIDQFKTIQSDKYCTDLWFEEAIKWMDKKADIKDKPFFSYIALNAPHGPLFAKPKDKALYSGIAKDSATASFFGMIHNIDENMKTLDTWLEEKQIKENTIVIYMNDNGGTTGVKTYNAGMRGKKGSNYDGGHRGACFIRYPKEIKTAKIINYPSRIADLLPTLIDLLDFNNQDDFDGVSLKSQLLGVEKKKDRMFVVQYGGRIKPKKYYSCVVYNNWRLVGENELYNLTEDAGQKNNLIKINVAIANKMKKFYENWWKDVAPTIEEMVPVIIDTENENPTTITSNTWTEVDVDNAYRVSAAYAVGEKKGGIWNLNAMHTKNYSIELSRWPFHINTPLTSAGPTHSVGGTHLFQQVEYGFSPNELKRLPSKRKLRPTVSLPIHHAILMVDGVKTKIIALEDATSLTLKLKLKKGDHKVQAWFEDIDNKAICGAYYMKISH